jgi:chromosome segregation ATPase
VADERALAAVRELEVADERVAAALVAVGELQRELSAIREHASANRLLLSSAPERREAAARAITEGGEELARRREELVAARDASAEADRSGDENRAAAAKRAVERAEDHIRFGERKVERALRARDELERALAEAEAETPALEEQARAVSAGLRAMAGISASGLEPPAPGLDGLEEWASRVSAALLVVGSGLETERERLVRQANEIAASVLGEPAHAGAVSRVRAELERA